MKRLLFGITTIFVCGCYHTDKQTIQNLVTINESLIETKSVIELDNRYTQGQFEAAMASDPKMVKPLYDRAMQAIHFSDNLVQRLQVLKEILAKEVGGIANYADSNTAYLDNKDAVIKCYNILLNGVDAQAKLLKKDIAKYRSEMMSLLYFTKDTAFLKVGLLTADYINPDSKGESWEEHNFGHTPLIADIETLTKLQIDIRNCESTITRYLLCCITSEATISYFCIYFGKYLGSVGRIVASVNQLDSIDRISYYPPINASFEIQYVEKGKHIVLSSPNCLLTPAMHEEIRKLSKGDKIIIQNVTKKGPDGYDYKHDGPTIVIE